MPYRKRDRAYADPPYIPDNFIVLKFPETMEIVVFPFRNIRRLDGEYRLRHLTRRKELSICFTVGYNLDPFDVMILLHGMGDTSYLHPYAARHFFYKGNMLFLCLILCIFRHRLHWLVAAHQLTHSAVQDFHDITANLSFVYTSYLFAMINLRLLRLSVFQ